MKTALLAFSVVIGGLVTHSDAFAQRELMGAFYQMQMAPTVCGWKDAPSAAKLDATIAAQEQALRITAAEKATMRAAAGAEIRADATNCADDGVLRMMFNEAVK